MLNWRMIWCCVAILVSFCGCAKESTPGNRVEDEREIRQLESEASKSIAAKDLDNLVSLYADDAALYDDRNPSIRGKDAIRATWQVDFTRPGLTMSTKPLTVEVSKDGNMAWAHGIYSIVTNVSGGKSATDNFEYAMVYTRQTDGKWKIMADCANSELRSRLAHRPPKGKTTAGAFAPLIGLACLFSGLWFLFGMPIVAIISAWKFFRNRKLSTGLLVSVVMLIVFFLAAVLLWRYFSAHEWNLPMANAFYAAGDTARYGNPVEDTAEGVLVGLLVLSTFSAVAAGIMTGIARKVWIHHQRLAMPAQSNSSL